MRLVTITILCAVLGACGQSSEESAANQAASAKPEKKTPYCFFKDAETKEWTARRGDDGNIVVEGKAYRSDSRYKAVLGDAVVSGTRAEVRPSITVNDGAYAAPGNWWDVSATIPDSATVDTVDVLCGAKTVAELKVPAAG